MPRAGVGFSAALDPKEAALEAAEAAGAQCGAPSVAIAFAAGAHGPELGALLDTLGGALGTRALVGATGQGVVGAGRESQGESGLAVLALEGIETATR